MQVLIIEDDAALAEMLRISLEKEDFAVRVAADAKTGLALARELPADVVITDLTLPGMDGIEACRQLRTFSDAYVIMLTGRAAELDRLVGLSVGADDYVTKPFFARELVARIRAMERRPRSSASAGGRPARCFGALTIDVAAREVTVDGRVVDVSRTEYDILEALSGEPKVSMSRSKLLERVWGPNWFGDDHVIDVHVSNLRRKLNDDSKTPHYIKTVRGFGYRMGSG